MSDPTASPNQPNGPKPKRQKSGFVTTRGSTWNPESSRFVRGRRNATSTPVVSRNAPVVSRQGMRSGSANSTNSVVHGSGLSAESSDASDLVRATIQAEDSNLLSCSSNGSDDLALLSAVDFHQANEILEGSGDSWLDVLKSPNLSPIVQDFPQAPLELKVMAATKMRYIGVFSLKALSRLAAAAVLNLGCEISRLPAGPKFQPVLSLMALSSVALRKGGIPRLNVLAKVQAAATLKTGCDVSRRLPEGPKFAIDLPVPVPNIQTPSRKRKAGQSSPEPFNTLCESLGSCKLDGTWKNPRILNLADLVSNVDGSMQNIGYRRHTT